MCLIPATEKYDPGFLDIIKKKKSLVQLTHNTFLVYMPMVILAELFIQND